VLGARYDAIARAIADFDFSSAAQQLRGAATERSA
jgi:hypothetical protein